MAAVAALLALLWPLLCAAAAELEMVEGAAELACSEGLTGCHVGSVSQFAAALPDSESAVNVEGVRLKAVLCCTAGRDCEPCLQVIITIQGTNSPNHVPLETNEHNDEEEPSSAEGSGQAEPPELTALVKVCFSSPGKMEFCMALNFKARHTGTNQVTQQPTHELLLTRNVAFGTDVVVIVHPGNTGRITIPSVEEVCPAHERGTVKVCDNAPRLRVVHQKNVVLLQLEESDARQEDIMCQMLWNETPGDLLIWPKGKKELAIASNMVAPCLCFQVWWQRKTVRNQFCPFKNQKDALESMQNNISVSMAQHQTREGGVGLSWNVTAPCRLEAEVWLCKREQPGSQCEEVRSSRQRVHDGWIPTRKGHWRAGDFNGTPHPTLCVQMKIQGLESLSEPQCPFTTPRWRWSPLLLVGSLFMCLVVIGVYLVQEALKGYLWRWLKEDDVKGAVPSGHVVLLYAPDDDPGLPELMCHLGSSLQTLGFSVSLDLWSQGELSALGTVPWFHSRLDQLKRQGGKAVLVLTHAACQRADEWAAQSCGRSRDTGEDGRGREDAAFSSVDVFSASLSCIYADYLQGCAGERFTLVQFESMPPRPPGASRALPELFRGLHVYSLPSQSLGFLTELAVKSTASARRRRALGIRRASRFLARRLSEFTGRTPVSVFAGASLDYAGASVEDCGEMILLRPCLPTPPTSPETSPDNSEMNWIVRD